MSEPMTDEWPQPGDLGSVKCSDGQWRTAFCVTDAVRGLNWIFPNSARRYVDTSTSRRLTTDLTEHAAENRGVTAALKALDTIHTDGQSGQVLHVTTVGITARDFDDRIRKELGR